MKTRLLLATLAALALPVVAHADDIYVLPDQQCSGGDGLVSIGAGTFSIHESRYDRVSERRPVGDGFFEAEYDQSAEGESYGVGTVRLRITPDRVDGVLTDGRTFTATRCR